MSSQPPDRNASNHAPVSQAADAWIVTARAREWAVIADAPLLSAARAVLLHEVGVVDEQGETRRVQVPLERPLTVLLNGAALVTLMTLGAAPEFLVLGYLRNRRIIGSARAVRSITVDWDTGVADVVALRADTELSDPAPHAGERAGLACALGTVFDDVIRGSQTPAAIVPVRTSRAALLEILDIMQRHDAIHRAAGSVHSCALFLGAELLVAIEDVSRHNGVDTVTGWMLQHGVRGDDKTLFTTGRLTAEMVMKAAYNGIAVLVSRNGVTSMGYELAARLGMNVFARAAKQRYLSYLGADRLDP